MNTGNFFAELKRRNVYKVAVAYAVVGWLLIQIATQVFPFFEIPNWGVRLIVLLIAVGFPVALVLAWAFELTPEGLKRTEAADGAPIPRSRRHAWIVIVIIAGAMSLGLFFLGRYTAPKGERSGSRAKSIAVLPFENLSDDKANAYFADGIHDEIITRLAKIGELKVISRSSTQRYRSKGENATEIARQLGVAHLVEGSVQKVGNRVRINVQLIEAQNDEHLWADLYDRNLTDIFAVQSEVATAIARSLQAKLTGREREAVAEKPTDNTAAYDAYLRGIDFASRAGQTPDNQRQAVAAFEEAVRLDPQFAQAWAALSRENAGLHFQQIDATPARKEAARTAAATATRLDPAAAETLLANAYYRYHIERDYNGARELFEKIQREVPSSSEATEALARIARRQSRWKESLRLYEEAAKLNPRDAHLFLDRAWTFSMLRLHPETHDMIDRALAILPEDPDVLINKAKALQVLGDLPAARSVLARIQKFPGSDPTAIDIRLSQLHLERRYDEAIQLLETKLASLGSQPTFDSAGARQFLGWMRSLSGDSAGAKEAYLQAKTELEIVQREQPRNNFIASTLAMAEAGLGNKEAALREGERAVALLPASEDPVYGPITEEYLAAIEAEVGEIERAITRIERLLTTPYGAFPITQALLRLDPSWDSLRTNPRFQKLVSGPEPKTIYK